MLISKISILIAMDNLAKVKVKPLKRKGSNREEIIKVVIKVLKGLIYGLRNLSSLSKLHWIKSSGLANSLSLIIPSDKRPWQKWSALLSSSIASCLFLVSVIVKHILPQSSSLSLFFPSGVITEDILWNKEFLPSISKSSLYMGVSSLKSLPS